MDWTKFEAYERGAAWRAMRHRLHFRPVEAPSAADLARDLFLYTQRAEFRARMSGQR